MTTLTLTINGNTHACDASLGQIAALGLARSEVMGKLSPGEGQDSDTPLSERPGYIGDDVAYLQSTVQGWATREGSVTTDDVDACIARCLTSWDAKYNGTPTPETPPADPLSGDALKASLATYAANKRYQVMVDGITVGGVTIPGDDVSQQRLKSARDLLVAGAISEPITIVIGLAVWTATVSDLTTIINALANKTQAAFATQGSVVQCIVSGTITTTAEIDAANWPS